MAKFSGWSATLVVVLVTATAAVVPNGLATAGAQDTDDPSAAVETDLFNALSSVGLAAQWISIGTIDPRAMIVDVSGGVVDELRENLIDNSIELAEIRPIGGDLITLLAQLDEIDELLFAERQHNEGRLAVTTLALSVVDSALGQAAVARYVRGADLGPAGGDLEAIYTDATRSTLVDVAVEDLLVRHAMLVERRTMLEAVLTEFEAAMADNEATRVAASEELETLRPRWDSLEDSVPRLLSELSQSRMGGTVTGLGLSLVTLDAYLTAEAIMSERRPECGIRWQAVAGIGRVESNHGRDRGGKVLPNGRLTTPFLGLVLDGSIEGTQVVADTDGGALDGNAEFDRAVGPFQFLPRSWRVGAIDGNADGVIDIQNLYDGAASAGEYLCSRVSGLSDAGALRSSFLTYNNSGEYADRVAGWVSTYDQYQINTDALGAVGVASGANN